ncbi:MAG: DUF4401 domain-containing protein [Bacteroidota bacterium]
MEKLDHIKKLLEEIKHSEGEGFVLNQTNLSEEISKYEKENASLVIKIITILGGILGSSFLVAAISTLFNLNSKPVYILSFAIFLIVVSVISSRLIKLLILDTIFVSTLLWGILLVSVSLSGLKVDEKSITLYFLLMGVFTIVISKNTYQSLIALLIIAGSLLWLIKISTYFWLFHVYNLIIVFALVQVFLNEAKIISAKQYLSNLYSTLKIGLIIIFIISLGLISVKSELLFHLNYSWISSIAPIAAVLIFMNILMNKLEVLEKNSRTQIYIISGIVLVLTAISPAIIGSILVLLLCFYVNYKTGFIIGVLSLIYFVCMLYYELDYSLLIKSEMLFVTGIIFGGIYFFNAKKLVTDEKL